MTTIQKVRKAKSLVSSGWSVGDAIERVGISSPTYYKHYKSVGTRKAAKSKTKKRTTKTSSTTVDIDAYLGLQNENQILRAFIGYMFDRNHDFTSIQSDQD